MRMTTKDKSILGNVSYQDYLKSVYAESGLQFGPEGRIVQVPQAMSAAMLRQSEDSTEKDTFSPPSQKRPKLETVKDNDKGKLP